MLPPKRPPSPRIRRRPAAALHPAFEPRHLGLDRIARHVDQRLMAARVVEAEGDQVLHAQLAHVAERHRRAGFASLVRCHKVTDLILGRHLADSVEVDDVVEAAGLNADIDDAALGE